MRFERSDLEVTDDGRSLLEQAEAAGLSPGERLPHGHLPHLHARQAAGAVTDLRDGRVSDAPDAASRSA
jgi:stearoyl-CoA 9-desaturase NADPH oxidoreductase